MEEVRHVTTGSVRSITTARSAGPGVIRFSLEQEVTRQREEVAALRTKLDGLEADPFGSIDPSEYRALAEAEAHLKALERSLKVLSTGTQPARHIK